MERQRRTKGLDLCSNCDEPRDRPGRYCKACHAAYMREWRKSHPLTPEQHRDNARSYDNVYLRRGLIQRQGGEVCGARAEMHHDDYDQPLAVRWLCRRHHLAHHA